MKRFDSLIRNKRVCFVGPATILMGKNLGDWINGFDTVIRTNGALNLLGNVQYEKDYGSKIDILYVNVQFMRESHPLDIKKMKRHRIKTICFKSGNNTYNKFYGNDFEIRNLIDLTKDMGNKIPSCLMGCILIEDVLRHKPKEFWVTGIDFYVTKPKIFIPSDYREYYPEYLPKKVMAWADKNMLGKPDGHDKKSNTGWIYDRIVSGKIKTHDFIKEKAEKVLYT